VQVEFSRKDEWLSLSIPVGQDFVVRYVVSVQALVVEEESRAQCDSDLAAYTIHCFPHRAADHQGRSRQAGEAEEGSQGDGKGRDSVRRWAEGSIVDDLREILVNASQYKVQEEIVAAS
jgi:hypothetical protein